MPSPGQRLRDARTRAGYESAGAFARAHRISEATYRAHESGFRNFKASTARFYAQRFSVSWEWLLFGEGEPSQINANEDLVIPAYDLRVSAGHGAVLEVREAASESLTFPKRWVRQRTQASPRDLAMLIVAGDSMSPTLSSGDWVLVDLQHRRVTNAGIYVVRVEDQLLIKRAQLDPNGRLSLTADNPQYPPVEGLEHQSVDIVGRALWLGRDLL